VHTGFWGKKHEGKDHLVNSHVNGRIILKWILKTRYGEAWTGLIWLRIGTGRWQVLLNVVMNFRVP
jgi:hypothetical protein